MSKISSMDFAVEFKSRPTDQRSFIDFYVLTVNNYYAAGPLDIPLMDTLNYKSLYEMTVNISSSE